MKKIFLALIGIAILSSCNKEQLQPDNEITYTIECNSCMLTYEDEVWNSSNELDRSKNQYVNVYGKHTVQFTHKKLKSATLSIYVSAMTGTPQMTSLVVTKSGKVVHSSKEAIGGFGMYDVNKLTYEIVF